MASSRVSLMLARFDALKACTGSYFTAVFVEKKSDKVHHFQPHPRRC